MGEAEQAARSTEPFALLHDSGWRECGVEFMLDQLSLHIFNEIECATKCSPTPFRQAMGNGCCDDLIWEVRKHLALTMLI